MPEIFRFFGLRFFFYSHDHLPIHVHVKNADGFVIIQVEPLLVIREKGMKVKDVKLAKSLVKENKGIIINYWKEHFK